MTLQIFGLAALATSVSTLLNYIFFGQVGLWESAFYISIFNDADAQLSLKPSRAEGVLDRTSDDPERSQFIH